MRADDRDGGGGGFGPLGGGRDPAGGVRRFGDRRREQPEPEARRDPLQLAGLGGGEVQRHDAAGSRLRHGGQHGADDAGQDQGVGRFKSGGEADPFDGGENEAKLHGAASCHKRYRGRVVSVHVQGRRP